MSEKQVYQVPKGEEDHYHLKCVFRRHIEEEKRYEEDVSIVTLSKSEYTQWDKFKEVLGFSSVTMLHDPTEKVETGIEKYPVVYLGESKEITKDEIKEILDNHKVKVFNGWPIEKLIKLVSEITPEE